MLQNLINQRTAKSQLVAELGPVQPQLVTSFMDRIVLKMFEKLSIFFKSSLCLVTCIKRKESEDKVSFYEVNMKNYHSER